MPKPSRETLSSIQAIVFDFDGVFTDNRVIVSENGEESVVCDRGDGMGITLLKHAGIRMMILSKEKNPVVKARGDKLGLEVIQGCDDKLPAMKKWLDENRITTSSCAYMGNDINDKECLLHAGLAVIPHDAHHSVRKIGAWRLKSAGGRGAIRELADGILESRP
jgi:YrbI family 3-deoxy-D-manno-octulosonate 8-phosphate phosphatase